MKFSDYKCKEVINIRDCRKLGYVNDLDFDECSGQITAIIVAGKTKWFNFCATDNDTVICYHCIKQIGPDIILVDINC